MLSVVMLNLVYAAHGAFNAMLRVVMLNVIYEVQCAFIVMLRVPYAEYRLYHVWCFLLLS